MSAHGSPRETNIILHKKSIEYWKTIGKAISNSAGESGAIMSHVHVPMDQ